MKKPIPKGKKGKGIRALKKKAPAVAKRMGYKKGMRARQWQNFAQQEKQQLKKSLMYTLVHMQIFGLLNIVKAQLEEVRKLTEAFVKQLRKVKEMLTEKIHERFKKMAR